MDLLNNDTICKLDTDNDIYFYVGVITRTFLLEVKGRHITVSENFNPAVRYHFKLVFNLMQNGIKHEY
jgi:hypothetical protein